MCKRSQLLACRMVSVQWAASRLGLRSAGGPHHVTGHSGKGCCCGRNTKGHPGAVSLSAGLPVCVPEYGAAEQTPGEAGAGFFREAQPSAELWPGKAGASKGLWVTDEGRPRAVQQMLLGPKREHEESNFLACTEDAANWCKVLTSPRSGVSPLDSHLPSKSVQRSPQRSQSAGEKEQHY